MFTEVRTAPTQTVTEPRGTTIILRREHTPGDPEKTSSSSKSSRGV